MQTQTAKVQCTTCKRVLPLSKFRIYKNQKGNIRYRHDCRDCEREKDRERRQKQKAQRNIENIKNKLKDINKTIEKNNSKVMQCAVCKQILSRSNFRKYKNRSGSIGYRRSCRECERKVEYIRCQKQKVQKDEFRFLNFYRRIKGYVK